MRVDAAAALPLFAKLKAALHSANANRRCQSGSFNKVIQGDCLARMKQLADNSVDLVVTDPPYGYSFMGKDWDKAVPSEEVWRECLRVLKPGAFAFIMTAPRSDVLSRMSGRIETAGFRADFSTLFWTYASGFPKAMNIAKMVDKRVAATRRVIGTRKQHDIRNNNYGTKRSYFIEQIRGGAESPIAKGLEGSYGGFQPKPAVEVIIVAMKPLSEITYVDQASKNGKGITWLDDCRIPTTAGEHEQMQENRMANRSIRAGEVAKGYGMRPEGLIGSDQKPGRFPGNLLVSNDVLNDGRITKATIDRRSHAGREGTSTFAGHQPVERIPRRDFGSFSRYFSLDAWWTECVSRLPPSVQTTFPFLIVPKSSKTEKNKGLEGLALHHPNHHPTVKPLKLMAYLITLGSRPGDVVLDPFLGSGTTALAAKALGRNFVGFELSREYCAIAEARLASSS